MRRTARAQVSSSVKRNRCQSQLHPIDLSCSMIRVFVRVFPSPNAFHQRLASQVVPRLAFLFLEPFLHNRLCRDAGVVGAGHPERVEALHPLHPDQDVLQCVVQRVAQVQSTRSRWAAGSRSCTACDWHRVRHENARLLPLLIDPLLGLSVIETIRKTCRQKMQRTSSR